MFMSVYLWHNNVTMVQLVNNDNFFFRSSQCQYKTIKNERSKILAASINLIKSF